MIGRRRAIALATGSLIASSVGDSACGSAQDFPDHVIQLVVPYGPGSGTDTISRATAQFVADDLGHPVIVENRPGADGAIGSSLVARSKPDGYTILAGANGPIVTGPFIQKGLSYSPARDLQPVAMLAYLPFVLIVPSASSVKTVANLVELSRSKPGRVTYGTSGIGSSGHLAGALFERDTGIKMQQIPYTGAAATLLDVIAGRIDCSFAALPSVIGAVKSGQVRAVATATLHRSPLMPDLPTIAESGYQGYDAGTWVSIMAPSGTPHDIVAILSKSAVKAVASQKMKAIMTSLGAEPFPMESGPFADYLVRERARWQALIKDAGIGGN